MRLGVDEVVTTLLLNFIVLLFVSAMLDGPMKDPSAMGWPQSVALARCVAAGKLIERSRVHTGLLLALRWRWLRVGGDCALHDARLRDPRRRRERARRGVCRRAGARTLACWWRCCPGALAGLAGAVEVAGRTGYVTLDMSPGYGYRAS